MPTQLMEALAFTAIGDQIIIEVLKDNSCGCTDCMFESEYDCIMPCTTVHRQDKSDVYFVIKES